MEFEQLLAQLPESYTQADRELVERAYRVAVKAHEGQKRASGEPYINHCMSVAAILADLRMPAVVVAAGLLHDTVEDTEITLDDLRRDFGNEIAALVDGVTKLTSLPHVSRVGKARDSDNGAEGERGPVGEEATAPPELEGDDGDGEGRVPVMLGRPRARKRQVLAYETLRKTLLAMGEDVRVVIIKLADRLHNMRTLGYLPEAKRRRIAQETLDVFAPLANRLGIWQIKWQLEDLAFRYVAPDIYKDIAEKLEERRTEREQQLAEITARVRKLLESAGIEAQVYGRPKHIYSIYRKMQRKGVPFKAINDIRGIRVIVDEVGQCYQVLGIIHTHWRPIPGEFDDYIANPKENFYQSLHTTVIYDDGQPLEVQIRTHEMHQHAEYGIAAHWRYKEGVPYDPDFEAKVQWLRQLMEWQQDVEDAFEFMEGMRSDVFTDRVYVFTPKGDIIDLPAGSTPIDFAYHIHTEIGHRCRGARVNGKLVPLSTPLKNGDVVEIITAKRGGPSRDWLNPSLGLVKTQRARSKIRRWFRQQAREQNLAHGRALLEKELKRLALEQVNLERLARDLGYAQVDDLFVAVGTGDLPVSRIVSRLSEIEPEQTELPAPSPQEVEAQGEVAVMGVRGVHTHLAQCCNPAPGDPIVGYVTRGRGVTIHRQDCPNILSVKEKERLIQVTWGHPVALYPVPIVVRAVDREGLMKDISIIIADEGLSIQNVRINFESDGLVVVELVIGVKDIAQLSHVLNRIENLPNVLSAYRKRTT
ncbi:MAG TPA: bifunctional (p)ppGpp synthetase/guanosine-3',5'-bis(diphosphate) 3'-pyrophosphohydrolase [Anaerolineae bacterium]|nr:bifunctional (p)ppGpp synthetase/guanosine-3',5'-bis(diphosphate) 3'-pyrophosphohydrolase [Anaerolineae bacterium]HID83616.1 bifunctional (p)ppGpp synthetase/guanosine-3',5'-bis(diphosphate) 3'-pyrophosphohydrolase [Anaerolineales bacterium]HIQ08980.1 bifunctional (p)ppGpp synthetase/guanosine-3',5'-bis(diphosphate) 3'-pyrophosphohydrolase [Anaerolineaceae bacterium]